MLTEKEIFEIANPGSKGTLTIVSNPSDPELEPELAWVRDNLVKFGNTAMNQTRTVLEDFDIATVVPSDPDFPPVNTYFAWAFKHKRTKKMLLAQISEKFGHRPQLNLIAELSKLALRDEKE